MRVKLLLITVMTFLGASLSLAQSPVLEVGDEQEPKPRAELLQLLRDDQNVRAEFDEYRKRHGLLDLDEKRRNEKLNKDKKLKKGFQAISLRLQEGEDARIFRLKQILVKYGWPGRTLVGAEAARAAWLLVQHYDRDLKFQRNALEMMKLLPNCEVENTHIAYLTDSVSLREEWNQNQVYGTVLTNENGKLVPKRLWEEVNVDKRRAELGLQPLAEYIRRQSEALLAKPKVTGASSFAQSSVQKVGDAREPELRAELIQLGTEDQGIRGEFDKYRRAHGVFGIDNKTLNEKLNNDPELKKGLLFISLRMQLADDLRRIRMKQIIAKYGWPGRSLVGAEAAKAAYLIVSHSQDLALQKLSLELMMKLGTREVENTQIATLTDKVLLAEGKKQRYGQMYDFTADGKLFSKPIEDEVNVDKRRAELGLEPLAEYLRREREIFKPKKSQ